MTPAVWPAPCAGGSGREGALPAEADQCPHRPQLKSAHPAGWYAAHTGPPPRQHTHTLHSTDRLSLSSDEGRLFGPPGTMEDGGFFLTRLVEFARDVLDSGGKTVVMETPWDEQVEAKHGLCSEQLKNDP